MNTRSLTPIVLIAVFMSAGCGSDVVCGGDVADSCDGAGADLTDSGAETALDLGLDVQDGEQLEDIRRETDVSALIEEGKYWLSVAEPGLAFEMFKQAVELAPQNQDALFGAGLSKYIHSVEFLAMLITLPSQFAGLVAGEGTTAKPHSQNDLLAEELHSVFDGLRKQLLEADTYLAQVDSPTLSFVVDEAPLYVLTRPIVNFRGKFDLADVYLLRSSLSFLTWTMELFSAQDFHTDMLTAVYEGMALRDKGKIGVWDVLPLVSQLMAADQRFLTLLSGEGEEIFQSGTQHVKASGAFLLEAIALLEEQGGEAEGEVTALFEKDDMKSIVLSYRVDFDSGEEEPVELDFSTEQLALAQNLLDAMDTPGTAIPFAEGPLIQLGAVLGFAAKLDLIRLLPVDIPIDLTNVGPAQATALMSVFFGNSVAFDYGALFAKPVGLRAFLPLMAKLADPKLPQDFWLEWECPGETAETGFPAKAGGFVCSKDAELVDGDHFQGTAHEFAFDGLASALPYLIWEDPSWGNVLKVDVLYIDEMGSPSDFQDPDLRLTNLGVHLMLEPLVGLLR